jgi:hypothetical protein
MQVRRALLASPTQQVYVAVVYRYSNEEVTRYFKGVVLFDGSWPEYDVDGDDLLGGGG